MAGHPLWLIAVCLVELDRQFHQASGLLSFLAALLLASAERLKDSSCRFCEFAGSHDNRRPLFDLCAFVPCKEQESLPGSRLPTLIDKLLLCSRLPLVGSKPSNLVDVMIALRLLQQLGLGEYSDALHSCIELLSPHPPSFSSTSPSPKCRFDFDLNPLLESTLDPRCTYTDDDDDDDEGSSGGVDSAVDHDDEGRPRTQGSENWRRCVPWGALCCMVLAYVYSEKPSLFKEHRPYTVLPVQGLRKAAMRCREDSLRFMHMALDAACVNRPPPAGCVMDFRKWEEERALWCIGMTVKACCLLYGVGVPKDERGAVQRALECDPFVFPLALEIVGMCYNWGNGVEQDMEKAAKYYLGAAEGGSSYAQTLLGLMYLRGHGVDKNEPKAVQWLTQGYEKESSEACTYLAMCYRYGVGVAKDEDESTRIWILAMQQGEPMAQHTLALLNSQVNPAESFRLFRLSAAQGDPFAQKNLAESFVHGTGTPVNLTLAAKFFKLSADQGEWHSQERLGHLYLTGKGVARQLSLAVPYFRLAAARGSVPAQTKLGLCLARGIGVPHCGLDEAFQLFGLAAIAGDRVAQFNLAVCYKRGEGASTRDAREALRWRRLWGSFC
ncbi:sel1 repeat family protein [Pelomyxa schiedti]|nr:sel1 repeat family protein [Pelomyxa schiedti]